MIYRAYRQSTALEDNTEPKEPLGTKKTAGLSMHNAQATRRR